MSDITVFKRHELKYMITLKQKEELLTLIQSKKNIPMFR